MGNCASCYSRADQHLLKTPSRTYGPYLRFGGYDPVTQQFRVSILFICHNSVSAAPPVLLYSESPPISAVGWEPLTGHLLSTHQAYSVWRFDLTTECTNVLRTVSYEIRTDHLGSNEQRFAASSFILPSTNKPWHWGYYSCNGFCDAKDGLKVGGVEPLWKDVLAQHQVNPCHVLVGDGDQIYNDHVWDVPALKAWTDLKNRDRRIAASFTPEMSWQVTEYYFNNYVTHFSQPGFKEALACIPHVMQWDDHDIFDGWGSYPADLQNCAVFQGVYAIARRFYLLFQQHATADMMHTVNGTFGERAFHMLHYFGPTTAVLALDCRSERDMTQVISPASYSMILQRLSNLPTTVKHLIVMTTVPLVYPYIAKFEKALMGMSEGHPEDKGNFLSKVLIRTGLGHVLLSNFKEPDLLDDLLDQWNSSKRKPEKVALVHALQSIAANQGIRVTIMSGDVHCGGVGQLYSSNATPPELDHRLMYQIISSAIANIPPPTAVVNILQNHDKVHKVGEGTEEKLINTFGGHFNKLRAQRNWCEVSQADSYGDMRFSMRMEPGKHQPLQPFDIMVPPLSVYGGQASFKAKLPALIKDPMGHTLDKRKAYDSDRYIEGVPNASDRYINGVPNASDRYINGVPNASDRYINGAPNGSDRYMSGVPNGQQAYDVRKEYDSEQRPYDKDQVSYDNDQRLYGRDQRQSLNSMPPATKMAGVPGSSNQPGMGRDAGLQLGNVGVRPYGVESASNYAS